jgi:RNA polymerase-binding protein DksA
MLIATQHTRTRYSDAELEEFRAVIVEKLEAAHLQLRFYMRQLTELADNEDAKIKNLDDAAVGSTEREYLSTLAVRQRSLIQHLENALIRIQNKAYGICRATGKLIARERLLAVPHATLSVDAKRTGAS